MQPEAPATQVCGYQRELAARLLDPSAGALPDVTGARGCSAANRLDIYRNNVVVSLIGALAAIYPAIKEILGDDLFRALARDHVRSTPPATPLLFEYGRDFPGFLDEHAAFHGHPWLGDVARLERAWLDAYHAADAAPLSPAVLAGVPAERLMELRFVAHPAASILESPFPALGIFVAAREERGSIPGDLSVAEDALITRPLFEVEVRHLPAGGLVFLRNLLAGNTLGYAARQAFAASADFDLTAAIAGLLEAGVFTRITDATMPHGSTSS